MIENENICNCLLEALYKKNKNGFYMKLLYSGDEVLNKYFDIKRYYSKINEYAWNYAFLLKLNRQPKVMNKLNQFIHILDYLDKLKQAISIKHPTIYLSELNLSCIDENIDDYINNINILRIVDHVVNKMIDEVIDKNKFDFCLPFD